MAILSQPGRFSKIFLKTCKKISLFLFFGQFWGQKMVKKVEIEGVGPIWRDPRRNSAYKPGLGLKNGWMATQLVPKRCDFGSLGVPGPASTPKFWGFVTYLGLCYILWGFVTYSSLVTYFRLRPC